MFLKRNNGFTVVEILVTVLILLMLFLTVGQLTKPVFKPKQPLLPPPKPKVGPVAFNPEVSTDGQYHSMVIMFEKIRNLHGGELLEHYTGTISLVLSCSAGDCLIADDLNDDACRDKQSIYGNHDWWMNNFFRIIRPADPDYPEAIKEFILQSNSNIRDSP